MGATLFVFHVGSAPSPKPGGRNRGGSARQAQERPLRSSPLPLAVSCRTSTSRWKGGELVYLFRFRIIHVAVHILGRFRGSMHLVCKVIGGRHRRAQCGQTLNEGPPAELSSLVCIDEFTPRHRLSLTFPPNA